jgi:hypothetical protein
LGSIGGILIKTNDSANDIELTTIGASSDIKLLSTAATVTITAGTEADITCATLDLNASTAATLDAPIITTTSTGLTTINSAGLTLGSGASETEINCGLLDINASGNITMDGDTIAITATGAGNDIRLIATDDIETTSDTIVFTTTSTGGPSIRHFSGITTGAVDLDLRNASATGYLMRLSETSTGGLTLKGLDNGINLIKSNGAASTLKLESAQNMILTSVTQVELSSGAGYDFDIDGGQDVNITGLAGSVLLNAAAGDVELQATADINLTGTNTTLELPTAGLFRVYNNSVLMFQVQDAQVTVTNADFAVTGTGSGSFPTLQVTGSADLQCNITAFQDSYASMANTRLGYTNSAQTTTTTISNTLTSRSSFSLPNRGVWLIICGYQWTAGASNTIESKEIVLSTTSGGSTAAAYGLEYFEEINDATGGGLRQQGTLSGVVVATAATTIHVNARAQVNSGTQPTFVSSVSWTRIG